MLTGLLVYGLRVFLAKGSAESPPGPGKRRVAGQSGTVPVAVPDGATLIRPTGSSHRLKPPRPGKRSAAGQDTANTVAVFMQDGATLIRPTGSSHRLIPRRPGKRGAAGR